MCIKKAPEKSSLEFILRLQGTIAQLVEPPAHNRSVPGSNPGGPTKDEGKQGRILIAVFFPRTNNNKAPMKTRSKGGDMKCTRKGAFFLNRQDIAF